MKLLRVNQQIGSGSSPSGTASTSAADEEERITCPKCGSEQTRSTECVRCGVIFSKIREDQADWPHHLPAEGSYTVSEPTGDGQRSRIGVLSLLLVIVAFGAYRFWITLDIRHPQGILVPSAPGQVIIKNPRPWKKGDKVVVPLAAFSLTARVLSKERYRFDRGADISPVDLALGWGPMSDQGILDRLEIAQGYRRYVLAPLSPGPPLPLSVLMESSSNMHMIPADDIIKDDLIGIRPGEIIELRGYLVGIQENGQWNWVSSLSRNDTGDGACEVVWVERVQTLIDVKPAETVSVLDSRRLLAP